MTSRWTCGPLAVGTGVTYRYEFCELGMDLIYFRYIRQIQIGEPLRSMPPNVGSEVYYIWSSTVGNSEGAPSALTY